MIDPLIALPGYVLNRAAAANLANLNQQLSKLGLRHSDASLLMLVASNAGLTQSDAGKMLDIQRANMVPLVSRLMKRDLILKEPVDGRSHGLFLTRKGKAFHKEAVAIINDLEARMLESVSEDLRPHLMPILSALWDFNMKKPAG
ncbi:MAG: MarR family winged helix-turn-helix transcriptional regulator [Sphingorhabdus sp.]